MPPEPTNQPELKNPPRPVFGLISFSFSFLAPFVILISVAIGSSDEFGVVSAFVRGLVFSALTWVVGLVAGIIGLSRSERPRWPALIGLALCALAATAAVLYFRPR